MTMADSASDRAVTSRLERSMLVTLVLLATGPWLLSAGLALGMAAFFPQASQTFISMLSAASGGLTWLAIWAVGAALIDLLCLAAAWRKYKVRLLRPLSQLTHTFSLFSQGNWEQRAEIVSQEIGPLAASFNRMADEMTGLHNSMQSTEDQRSRSAHSLAGAAEAAASAPSLDDLARSTTRLLVDQLGYVYASIYLLEPTAGEAAQPQAVMRHPAGAPAADRPAPAPIIYLEIAESAKSISGQALASGQAHYQSLAPTGEVEAAAPPAHLPLKGAAEAAVPLAVSGRVLGTLYVQSRAWRGSATPARFTEEQLDELKAIAAYLALAIKARANPPARQPGEHDPLAESGFRIAQANNEGEIFQILLQSLAKTPHPAVLLVPHKGGLSIIPPERAAGAPTLQQQRQWLSLPIEAFSERFSGKPGWLFEPKSLEPGVFPAAFHEWLGRLPAPQLGLIPIQHSQGVEALILIGPVPARQTQAAQALDQAALDPYIAVSQIAAATLEKISAVHRMENRLSELQALAAVSEVVSGETDLNALYETIHNQILAYFHRPSLPDVSFFLALYDAPTGMIEIPFMTEKSATTGKLERMKVDPFPLGEGLTSVLIRTRQPLMLVENVEEQMIALGGKLIGAYPRSWLGVPLLVGGEAIGAIVVQDTDHEQRFNENDQRLLSTLASQVAFVVRNARLLENARTQAEQEKLMAEISTRVWASTEMDTILHTTLQELGRSLKATEGVIALEIEPEAELARAASLDAPPEPGLTG